MPKRGLTQKDQKSRILNKFTIISTKIQKMTEIFAQLTPQYPLEHLIVIS